MAKGWTEERRQKARQRIFQNKPWERSTGPKTLEGKKNSAMNAIKHGQRSDVLRTYIQRILTLNLNSLEQFELMHSIDQVNTSFANELIKKLNENKEKEI